ncbi:MAG: hypothetical protein HWD60_16355 [Defluviicoccus sp.]|nr:MAG: hypothetical protein HWD60_16355 [Defluviicoccus sp.]
MQKELMGAVAMRLSVLPEELARRIRTGLNVLADPKIYAFGSIELSGTLSGTLSGDDDVWHGVAYASSELSEAKQFARAEPGTAFNLSAEELTAVHQRFAGRTPASTETLARASAAWREILAGRFRAYREFGTAGLAGYDRGGTTSWPGNELHHGDTAPYVPAALAAFVRTVDRFPALPTEIKSYFFWKKTEIDDRPAFVLSHVMIQEDTDAIRFALREFYVSHTYNVLQQFGMASPTSDGGTMLVVINSTITDRLPGIFTSFARSIGEQRALSALEDYFLSIRRTLGADTWLSGG